MQNIVFTITLYLFIVDYNRKIMILPLNQIIFGLIDGSDTIFFIFINNKNTKIPLETEKKKCQVSRDCSGFFYFFFQYTIRLLIYPLKSKKKKRAFDQGFQFLVFCYLLFSQEHCGLLTNIKF